MHLTYGTHFIFKSLQGVSQQDNSYVSLGYEHPWGAKRERDPTNTSRIM